MAEAGSNYEKNWRSKILLDCPFKLTFNVSFSTVTLRLAKIIQKILVLFTLKLFIFIRQGCVSVFLSFYKFRDCHSSTGICENKFGNVCEHFSCLPFLSPPCIRIQMELDADLDMDPHCNVCGCIRIQMELDADLYLDLHCNVCSCICGSLTLFITILQSSFKANDILVVILSTMSSRCLILSRTGRGRSTWWIPAPPCS